MSSIPPPAVTDTLPSTRVEAIETAKLKTDGQMGPAAKAALEREAMQRAETDQKLVPGKLIVEQDEQAQRFVQTIVDVQTQQVERRYPSETQLAFSRAIAAYMQAKAAGES